MKKRKPYDSHGNMSEAEVDAALKRMYMKPRHIFDIDASTNKFKKRK